MSLSVLATGCGTAITFEKAPAAGYVYGSGQPLRVALLDETGGDDWAPAIDRAAERYSSATPHLSFQDHAAGAHILITVRRYVDEAPPQLPGYSFQPGVGGFAAVYDASAVACNFPPSPLPQRCDGEIATVFIYLNDVIPAGDDIDARRERLLLHEIGHALGLTRHSPSLDIATLTARYGWP
jgi:hypothetical protein